MVRLVAECASSPPVQDSQSLRVQKSVHRQLFFRFITLIGNNKVNLMVWKNDPIRGIVDVQFKAFKMNLSAVFKGIPSAILMDFFDSEVAALSSD